MSILTIISFRFIMAHMVNKKNENTEDQDDIDITNNEDVEMIELDLEDLEIKEENVIKSLREKLKACEASKRTILEETQLAKADFLNARRRLEDERLRDRERAVISHVERILPLCDSFQVAMSNKEVWDSMDEKWRKGIEGIYTQLQNILTSYNVKEESPVGESFDPHLHEALSTTPVEEKDKHDTVMSVMQSGYKMTRNDDTTELIRPARVIIGAYEENK
jgi:molecular chaperone GrpE